MSLGRVVVRTLPAVLSSLLLAGCSGSPSDSPVLTAEMPLHLAEHLNAAVIEGSELPVGGPESIAWNFDEPQPDWSAWSMAESRNPMPVAFTDGALRVIVTDADRTVLRGRPLSGAGIYTDLPGLLSAPNKGVLL